MQHMHHSLGEVVVALGDVETSHAQLLDVVQGWLQARLVNDAKGCLMVSDLALQRKDLQSGLSDLPSFVKHLEQNGVSVSDLIQQYNGTVVEEWQVPVPESVVIASAGGTVAHIDDSFKCKSKNLAEVTQDESPTCDFQDGPQEARKDVPKDNLPEFFKSPEHAHDDSIKAGLDKSKFGSVTIKEPHDLIASVMCQQKPTLDEQEWPVLALPLKQADQAKDDQVADDYVDEPAREKQPGSDHIVVDDQARATPKFDNKDFVNSPLKTKSEPFPTKVGDVQAKPALDEQEWPTLPLPLPKRAPRLLMATTTPKNPLPRNVQNPVVTKPFLKDNRNLVTKPLMTATTPKDPLPREIQNPVATKPFLKGNRSLVTKPLTTKPKPLPTTARTAAALASWPPLKKNEIEFIFGNPRSVLPTRSITSSPLTIGNFTFRILVFPRGTTRSPNKYLGAFVLAEPGAVEPDNKFRVESFKITVVNWRDFSLSKVKTNGAFGFKASGRDIDRGWHDFLPVDKLCVGSEWTALDGSVCVRAQVEVSASARWVY